MQRSLTEPIYKKGDQVRCPGCFDLIAEFKDDALPGFIVDGRILQWKNQVFYPSDEYFCQRCGIDWVEHICKSEPTVKLN